MQKSQLQKESWCWIFNEEKQFLPMVMIPEMIEGTVTPTTSGKLPTFMNFSVNLSLKSVSGISASQVGFLQSL